MKTYPKNLVLNTGLSNALELQPVPPTFVSWLALRSEDRTFHVGVQLKMCLVLASTRYGPGS